MLELLDITIIIVKFSLLVFLISCNVLLSICVSGSPSPPSTKYIHLCWTFTKKELVARKGMKLWLLFTPSYINLSDGCKRRVLSLFSSFPRSHFTLTLTSFFLSHIISTTFYYIIFSLAIVQKQHTIPCCLLATASSTQVNCFPFLSSSYTFNLKNLVFVSLSPSCLLAWKTSHISSF